MKFVRVAGIDDLAEESTLRVTAEGRPIAVARVGDSVYAVDDTCTHEKESLAAGFVEGTSIECPRHGAMFDLKTGKALTLPATNDLRTYEVKLENGEILVGISD